MSVIEITRTRPTRVGGAHRRVEPRRKTPRLTVPAGVAEHLPLVLMLGLAGVLFGWNVSGYPIANNDDEGTYLAQAWAVAHQGLMAHYTYWYDHPPGGWMQLAAFLGLFTWLGSLSGGYVTVVTCGRVMMAAVGVVSAFLLHRLSVNLRMPRWAALLVPTVWALSPLTVYMGRQVFLDNIALMWLLGSFVLATGKPKLSRHVLSGVEFAIAVLSKETAVLAGLGIVWILWRNSWRQTRNFSIAGWLSSTLLISSSYFLYAGLKGEIAPGAGHTSILGALLWQIHDRKGSGFIFASGSDANSILHGWLGTDPFLLVAGLSVAVVALLIGECRPIATVPVLFALAGMRPGGYLPIMHVVNLLPWLALLLVHVPWRAWRAAERCGRVRWAAPALRATLAIAVATVSVIAVPRWTSAAHTAMTVDFNGDYRSALAYVDANLPRDTTVLTDDDTWNDLVQLGWSPERWHGPIWHFKLDRDPEARTYLPGGWRDVDYVLLGPPMSWMVGTVNISAEGSPQVWEALQNGTVVQAWGQPGPYQIRLIKVNGGHHPTGWPPPANG